MMPCNDTDFPHSDCLLYVLLNDVCIRKSLAFTLHSMRSLKKSMLRENVMTKTFAFS